MIVEVCANSLESALIAQRAGAHRIELCAELPLGGITPSYGLIKAVKEELKIPVHVLIRPRSGDFTYSDLEFKTMLEDIDICKSLGVEGIVSGILDREFQVDWHRMGDLLRQCDSCSFTFHRAFDWVNNPMDTYLRLQEMGVHTLLSSGQASSAVEGLSLLKALNKQADGCLVMPGAGIRADNAAQFKEEGFNAIHLSASRTFQNTKKNPPVPMSAKHSTSENEILMTDYDTLKNVIQSVNKVKKRN